MTQVKRSKEKYNGYFVTTYYGESGEITENKIYVGSTYAVSEAQAANNIKYRRDGEVPNFAVHDLGKDTSVTAHYRVVLASDDK